jgi:hypothetical protein
MRSIERRFKNVSKKHPDWSSDNCLLHTVENQNFSEQYIARWFNKLVPEEDYSSSEKKDILANLYRANKPPDDDKK